MSDSIKTNIAAQVYNELNPSADVPIGGVLSQVKEESADRYAKMLRGDFAVGGSQHEAQMAKFRAEFDEKFKAQAVKGSQNEDADPTIFKDEHEQKKREGFMGVVDSVIGGLAGFFGGLGSIIWSLIKQFPGVQSMVSGISSWLSDKTDNRPDQEKIQEKRAAGMALSFGEVVNVGGMEISLTPEQQAQLYRQWSQQDFEKPVTANTPAMASLVTSAQVAPEITGQQPVAADPGDTNKVANVSADAKAAARAAEGAAATPQ